MSYQLNKTDGTLLLDLIDGQIDTASTNLTLVGRNYTGYGEYFNENFIKLLENFSNTAAPSNPLTGQLWWNSSDQRLQVYDGSVWKSSGGPIVQNTRPQMVAGDLWIDNLNNQVYAFDGTDLMLMGPQYSETQGKSGFEIGSILDSQSRSRTVTNLYVGGTLTAVISSIEFTPIYAQRVIGLVTAANPDGIIYIGMNIIDTANFKYRGIADSANALVTAGGVVRGADSFLPSTASGITTGTLTIQNSGGLTIGLSQNNVQKVVGPRFYIENQLTDHDLSLRVKSSSFGAISVDAIYVDASTAKVGIFTTNRLPAYTLDVEGDIRCTGNLIVEGDQTSIDVATLRVEDKNIEIAKTAAGVTLTGTNANNAGLILDTSDVGSKTWTWITAQDAWTSNVNIDISSTLMTYQIGGINKLTNDSLVNVTKALDLDQVGTLTVLQVDEININGKVISSTNDMAFTSTAGIAITGGGDINITDTQKITGVGKAISAKKAVELGVTESSAGTVATKEYADEEIATSDLAFSMDITGMGTSTALQNALAIYLNDMYPAAALNTNKVARIHTTSYAGATVQGVDVESAKNVSYIAVDSNGTQNESVVQDIVFDAGGASGTVILSPARTLMTYKSNGTAWSYQSVTAY
jgi:tartrate dehydratase beta subunit/fumarate hydratase class I family protein